MGTHTSRAPRHRAPVRQDGRWLHRWMVAAVLVLAFGTVNGVSGASSPSTDVNFTAVTPYKVMNTVSIGAGITRAVVVSGGSTTVPSNATTVRLSITVKGAKAGALAFHPAGDPGGSSGDTVAWQAGGTTTATIDTDIGERNKLSVVNQSAGTANVTATLIAFSTEVEAEDISSLGGTTGQVLTDTGTGAAWQTPNPAYQARNDTYQLVSSTQGTVASVTVPPGAYQVSVVTTAFQLGAGHVGCRVQAPNGLPVDERFANVDANIQNSTMHLQGMVQTATGGTITLRCQMLTGQAYVYRSSLIATKVGALNGAFTNGRTRPPPGAALRQPGQPGR